MPAYDSLGFDPPAPVARVTLRSSVERTVVEGVPMLLDTGADVTMVPRAAAERLAIREESDELFQLLSFDGSSSETSAVRLELVLCGRTFRGRFLLIDQDWGVLGRNVLNSLPIIYDGPRLAWAVRGET